MWPADGLLIAVGEQDRELAGAGLVDALKEPVVAVCGQSQRLVVGERGGTGTDHTRTARYSSIISIGQPAASDIVVGVVTAEGRFGGQVGVEGRLEVVYEVAGGHPQQQFLAFGGDAWTVW